MWPLSPVSSLQINGLFTESLYVTYSHFAISVTKSQDIADLESHLCYSVNIFEALHFTLYLEPQTGHYSSNLHTETPFTLA